VFQKKRKRTFLSRPSFLFEAGFPSSAPKAPPGFLRTWTVAPFPFINEISNIRVMLLTTRLNIEITLKQVKFCNLHCRKCTNICIPSLLWNSETFPWEFRCDIIGLQFYLYIGILMLKRFLF